MRRPELINPIPVSDSIIHFLGVIDPTAGGIPIGVTEVNGLVIDGNELLADELLGPFGIRTAWQMHVSLWGQHTLTATSSSVGAINRRNRNSGNLNDADPRQGLRGDVRDRIVAEYKRPHQAFHFEN
jgi:hypothetical protein